jgi:hypothetical protein
LQCLQHEPQAHSHSQDDGPEIPLSPIVATAITLVQERSSVDWFDAVGRNDPRAVHR